MLKEYIERLYNIVEYPILLKTIVNKIPREILKNLLFINKKLKFTPDIIIDIGAANGTWAKTARYLFPKAKLFIFEPIPDSFKNIEGVFNNDENSFLFNFALDNKNRMTDFHLNDFSYSSSILEMTEKQKSDFPFTKSEKIIEIESKRLDSFSDLGLSGNVFVKIDVQGLELRVLEGFGELIEKIDVILMEVNFEKYYLGQPNYSEIFSFMYKNNFEKFIQLNKYSLSEGDIRYCDILFYKKRIFEN